MTARRFRIACAQYDVGFFSAWGAYERKIEDWFARGVEGGGELLVFPEYCSMELASLFGPDVYGSLSEQLAALSRSSSGSPSATACTSSRVRFRYASVTAIGTVRISSVPTALAPRRTNCK